MNFFGNVEQKKITFDCIMSRICVDISFMELMETLSMFQQIWILYKMYYHKCDPMIVKFMYFWKTLEYKPIYMLGCVCLNIMIKKLRKFYKTPLYMVANVSIKPNWETWIEFTNAYESKQWQKDKFEKKDDFHASNNFEEAIEKNCRYTFSIRHFKSWKKIDNDIKSLAIALG
jgi:hypothetical protein